MVSYNTAAAVAHESVAHSEQDDSSASSDDE
jgi:hypothetical protein